MFTVHRSDNAVKCIQPANIRKNKQSKTYRTSLYNSSSISRTLNIKQKTSMWVAFLSTFTNEVNIGLFLPVGIPEEYVRKFVRI